MNAKKGLYLALGTAVISGFAIFLSQFAAKAIGNSHVFTTAKNIVVALILSLIILTPFVFKKLKKLNKNDWLKLILIGIIGGSIPFLLFFKGLSLAGSVNSAFIHKTLFIWVTILAIPFLKEKLSKIQLGALALLLFGNFFLIGIKSWSFGKADLLILIAALFWSVEYIIAKKALKNIDAKIVAWARMFFGSIILLGFVFAIGQGQMLLSLNANQWSWIGLTSVFLLAYVLTWYQALKYLPASVVTSVLVIASPITTALSAIFVTHKYSLKQLAGSILIICAVGLIQYAVNKVRTTKQSLLVQPRPRS